MFVSDYRFHAVLLRHSSGREIEKIEKYSQKNIKIVYNSLCVCVCVCVCADYICILMCVVV